MGHSPTSHAHHTPQIGVQKCPFEIAAIWLECILGRILKFVVSCRLTFQVGLIGQLLAFICADNGIIGGRSAKMAEMANRWMNEAKRAQIASECRVSENLPVVCDA